MLTCSWRSISSQLAHCLPRRLSTQFGGYLQVSDEVASALHHRQPVVALESTIITQGMPFPTNIQTAQDVELVVRQHGATPATVAVIGGKLSVGLSRQDLEYLGSAHAGAVKVSRRDLAATIAQGVCGGTTVSATMLAAHLAGIEIFVTGGIGGVHRGAETSMDISADLIELSRTPVSVVSAGVKSILDIGRTLEYLETQGVPVITVGPSHQFPAFFSQSSGFEAPHNVKTAEDAAKLIAVQRCLHLSSGILFAVPIPQQFAVDSQQLDDAIKQALQQAQRDNISGKDVTPYLLRVVNELMSGKSLEANIALVKNNAMVGSQIACALSSRYRSFNMLGQQQPSGSTEICTSFDTSSVASSHDGNTTNKLPDMQPDWKIVVIGGVNFDLSAAFAIENVRLDTKTHVGKLRQSFGGVGRNIADCLSRLGVRGLFVSKVGDDFAGQAFCSNFKHMNLSAVDVDKHCATAAYCCVLTSAGELMYGIGDFECHSLINKQYVSNYEKQLSEAELVCIDGNIPVDSMNYVVDVCSHHSVPVWFEPTDVSHTWKIFQSDVWKKLTYTSPNFAELRQMVQHLLTNTQQPLHTETKSVEELSLDDVKMECVQLCKHLLPFIPNIFVTLGKRGVILARRVHGNGKFPTRTYPQMTDRGNNLSMSFLHYRAEESIPRVSVSGSGDCFAATVMAGILHHHSPDVAVRAGLLAAIKSLESFAAVPDTINPQFTSEQFIEQQSDIKPTVIQH